MPKIRKTIADRIYTRTRGENSEPRYYGDFRDYADVGGGQEPLVPSSSKYATTCSEEAVTLATERLVELQGKRARVPSGPTAKRIVSVVAKDHLERKAKLGEGGRNWLGNVQVHLETFAKFVGENTDLATPELRDIENFRAHLLSLPNGRGGTLSTGSVTHYLNSVSNMYDKAIQDGLLPQGSNLIKLLPTLSITRVETPFLEIPEMARILDFAFNEFEPARADLSIPYFPVILATLALSGLREAEALGLLVSDVNLERRVIYIRKNDYRTRLKTTTSTRVVPIFSQLAGYLEAYLKGPYAPKGQLLFPSARSGGEKMITDLRKSYDKMPMPTRLRRRRTPAEIEAEDESRESKLERALGMRRGPKPVETIEALMVPTDPNAVITPPLRSKMLRHTWTAARIQTTDRGRPISLYTVATELGHADTKMVEKVYAHLGRFRERGEEVEYKI